MKRKIILGFVIFMILTCFLGCSNPSIIPTEETSYKVEAGVITNSTYRTACNRIQDWDEINYSKIASIRNYLYDNTISGHEIRTDVSLNEIKEYLLSHGFSKYETDSEIKFLKENGNEIAFFEYRYGNDKKVWVYATK